ncbi:PilN domain-containing protein [Pseudotenacibaculum haliotis]|uniref:PilN domain-containing protein n=1 Tax=Pseudotenacibaculum haliotis TaxID=1862138 RepID=A0ABW5LWH8_9FLAO
MLRQKLTYGSRFCAIEHATNTEFYLLGLEKKKKELVIFQKKEFKDQEEVFAALKGQKHVYLIINNEQVLTKKVDFRHIAKESVVKAAFPNISVNDFYFEVAENDVSSTVSICRKEVIDRTVKAYLEKGISVIQFSLANNNFENLLPFLNDFQFHTSNTLFDVVDHKIVDWKKSKPVAKTYDINGLIVGSNQLLPLAGILSYYNGVDRNTEEKIQGQLVKEYQQKRFFQLGLRFGLGFLFVLLLVNFLVFSSYRNKVSDLTSELTLNETYKKQLINLTGIVDKKKKLVESINSVSNSKVIWYFDEISQSVPKTLLLSEINYQPLTRPEREGKPLIFTNDLIIVKGISKDNSDFTQWISELEEMKWIEKVSFQNYGTQKTSVTSFDFTIQLKSENR